MGQSSDKGIEESVVHHAVVKQTPNVGCGMVYLLCPVLFILNKALLLLAYTKYVHFLHSRVSSLGNRDLIVFNKANVNIFIEWPKAESIS